MLKKSRKAFTLVELLIVLIVIGILAGLMMVSSGSATDKAQETRCVADRRSIKSAINIYRAEHGSYDGFGDKLKDMFDNYHGSDISGDVYIMNGICPSGGIYTVPITDDKIEVKCSVHGLEPKILQALTEKLSDKTSAFYKYFITNKKKVIDSGAVDIEPDSSLAGISYELKTLLQASGIDINALGSWKVVYEGDNKFTIYYSSEKITNDPAQKIKVTRLDSDGKVTSQTVGVKENKVGNHTYYIYDI
ncbi:MAG: prepilin-type N-terminal cleavage/methylation domain-containing protein [bacterium]|nr:prepilin-type N-terminal cleavage/methylation domain-containing protein [bacterium]